MRRTHSGYVMQHLDSKKNCNFTTGPPKKVAMPPRTPRTSVRAKESDANNETEDLIVSLGRLDKLLDKRLASPVPPSSPSPSKDNKRPGTTAMAGTRGLRPGTMQASRQRGMHVSTSRPTSTRTVSLIGGTNTLVKTITPTLTATPTPPCH